MYLERYRSGSFQIQFEFLPGKPCALHEIRVTLHVLLFIVLVLRLQRLLSLLLFHRVVQEHPDEHRIE